MKPVALPWHQFKKTVKQMLYCLLALIIIEAALFFTLPMRMLLPSAHALPPSAGQVAVVLFHGFNDDYTYQGRETTRRLNHAIKLYREGKAEQIAVVGGNREWQNLQGTARRRPGVQR